MERSYYSADDEIAWGPLTLEEIKKELEGPPRNIRGRETDVGHSTFFTPSTTFSDEKVAEDKINNSSGTSAYFTPDESLAQAASQKSVFLEKLSEVIESENYDRNSPSPHNTISESKNSLMDILDLEDDEDIKMLENIQQTLVENTMRFVSPEKKIDDDIIEIASEKSFNEGHSNDYIIISDDSDDSLEMQSLHEESSVHVKAEKEDSRHNDSDTSNETESLSEEDNLLTGQIGNTVHDISEILDLTEESSEDEQDLVVKKRGQSSVVDFKELVEESRQSESACSLDHVEPSKSQNMGLSPINCESSDTSNSHVFNDTLEEIEMALKQGLDYEMPSDNKIASPISIRSETPSMQNLIKPQPCKKLKPTPSKYDYIQSPVADYIKKSPIHDHFKLPTRPPKSKVITPNPKSPQIQSKHFKNIMSPIGVYIKNSPQICLKQNVLVKTVPSLKASASCDSVKNKTDNADLPEVVYTPGREVVTSEKKDIILPSSIQKMVAETVITKHESRIARPINTTGISRKLVDGDVTTVGQSEEDVSFLEVKQAFIK